MNQTRIPGRSDERESFGSWRRGTRLTPLTGAVNKHLLRIFDKPTSYYHSPHWRRGIRDILLHSSPHDLPPFETLIGDGPRWGINPTYAVEAAPRGL